MSQSGYIPNRTRRTSKGTNSEVEWVGRFLVDAEFDVTTLMKNPALMLKLNQVVAKAYIVERCADVEEKGSTLESTVMREPDVV